MISVLRPLFNAEMREAAVSALENEKFVMGESVFKFEEEFARYCGVKHAVSTSSGTNALVIAMLAANMKGEVITTPASFIATSNAIIHAGCMPVFSDIDFASNNLDPALLSTARSKKLVAVMPVHLYGTPCEMDEINAFAEERGALVFEDACQAHGAIYKKRKTGALSAAGCFSFYSTKNLTVCGDGGMITTDDDGIAARAARLRDCGRKSQYEHDVIGFTSRLNTVNAAIGRVQLRMLDGWNSRRRAVARAYFEGLKNLDDIMLPETKPYSESSFHLFSVKTVARDALREHLSNAGIQTLTNYPIPLHLQPAYRQFGYSEGSFPNAEKQAKQVLCLPMHALLTDEEVGIVCDSVREFFEGGMR